MSGQYAGVLYCDNDKATLAANGDDFYHYAYCTDEHIKTWRDAGTLCPDCDKFIGELEASKHTFTTNVAW